MQTVLRPLDYVAIGLALSVTILSAVLVYAGTGAYDRVIIKGAGEHWVFPQGAAELIRVAGPLGDTVVELRDHTVRILASPCVNQTCVAAGAIHSHGQWIACLPNQVLVSIQRGTNSGPTPQGTELDGAAW
ncbi:MAG: NusG domain II-containing protein [Treponema sp.]|nr:NusG domain II-containing protein [Treponema sp.]